MEIAAGSGMNKSIARFPDVCMSPPSPPAGPLPVPYPDTSFSSDIKEGSSTVRLGGDPAALAQQSYYQPSALGDEAATRAFGMNIVTHQITGKTYFQAWSLDVKFEGKNVCRHWDITTSNHASSGTTTAGTPSIEQASLDRIKAGKCPCCGGPLHDNQRNADPMTEEQWYGTDDASIEALDKEVRDAQQKLDKLSQLKYGGVPKSAAKSLDGQIATARETYGNAFDAHNERVELKEALAEARASGCKNVPNEPDKDCGVYFALRKRPVETDSSGAPRVHPTTGQPMFKNLRAEWENGGRDAFVDWYDKANPSRPIPADHKIHHATPVAGGGCPLGGSGANGYANVVPDQDISARCREIDDKHLQKAQDQAQKRHLIP
jgi:hypothetical protein